MKNNSVVLLFKEKRLSEWVIIYEKILDGLNFMLMNI